MLPVIRRDVDEPVICACPDGSFCYWGFSQRKDCVVVFDRSDVVRQRTAAWLLFRFVVAREITADLRPLLSVIGGFENALRRGVEHIRIVRRKHQRRDPLEPVDKIDSAVSRIIQRNGTDVLYVLLIFVIATDVARSEERRVGKECRSWL